MTQTSLSYDVTLLLQALYKLLHLHQVSITVQPNRSYDCLNRGGKGNLRFLSRLTRIFFQPLRQLLFFRDVFEFFVCAHVLDHVMANLFALSVMFQYVTCTYQCYPR
jgi:hypothetical protein